MLKHSSMVATVFVATIFLRPSLRACIGQQVPAGAPAPAGSATAVAASAPAKGVFYILAEFTQSLNVKKLKPGDRIKAEVAQDVLWHGKIVIPVESRLIGHVTEVKIHRADDPGSRLGFVFDKLLLKHPREVNFQAVVQTLAAPAVRRSKVDEPSQMPPPMGGIRSVGQPVPMGEGTISRGIVNSGQSSSEIATNPAERPTFLPPPSPSDVTSSPQRSSSLTPVEQQKPMSVGMPLGVYGLKGVGLIPGPSSSTPGPVIVSRSGDVKLENGTQILLRVTNVTVPRP